jgi:signal transduction histidine kinase
VQKTGLKELKSFFWVQKFTCFVPAIQHNRSNRRLFIESSNKPYLWATRFGSISMSNIFTTIINAGVRSNLRVEEAQRVKLTNVLALLPIVVYVYFIYFGIHFGYTASVIIASSFLLLSLLGLWLNSAGKYNTAKFVLFLVNALCIAITHNMFNVGDSYLMLFFPLFVCYIVYYDIRREFGRMLPSLLLTFLCLMACFFLPQYSFFKVELPAEMVKFSIFLNYLISFGLFFIILVLIQQNTNSTHKKLIDAREMAETASKAKSTFLSNISHELRTPLNGIIGTTNLLAQMQQDGQQKEYIDVLKFSSDHMLHLIDDVLTFSRGEAGKIVLEQKSVNLYTTLEKIAGVFDPQFNNKRIALQRNFGRDIDIMVLADELRMTQVLNNLLSNALKFTRMGHVTITAKLVQQKNNQATFYFEIADTGVGIKADKLVSIFESFTQAETGTARKYGGTGLGLSISKHLLGLMGGQLLVESEYAMGSKFYFQISFELAPPTIPQIDKLVQSNGRGKLSNVKILAAEDNQINMMVLSKVLAKWEVQLTATKNGLEMLDAFAKDQYDILLIDLEMPEMDGYTAVKKIRQLNKEIPAFAFSATVYENMLEDLQAKGFTGFIPKPFSHEELQKTLESALS